MPTQTFLEKVQEFFGVSFKRLGSSRFRIVNVINFGLSVAVFLSGFAIGAIVL